MTVFDKFSFNKNIKSKNKFYRQSVSQFLSLIFVFNTLLVFSTLYLQLASDIGKFIYNIGAIKKILLCNFHF